MTVSGLRHGSPNQSSRKKISSAVLAVAPWAAAGAGPNALAATETPSAAAVPPPNCRISRRELVTAMVPSGFGDRLAVPKIVQSVHRSSGRSLCGAPDACQMRDSCRNTPLVGAVSQTESARVRWLRQDLVAGQIDLMTDSAASALSQVRAGTIRAHAVTAKSRLAAASHIPTVDEAGLPGFYVSIWHAFWVAKGTPKEI